MMRIDFDEGLRRGDAYKRVNDAAVKMGRRQLMELFEQKFRDAVSSSDIELGFPGEIIHKEITFPTCDLSQLPSALASQKLEEMLRIRKKSLSFGSTTMVARLAHARLYGTDNPYEHRSPEEIMAELSEIRSKYRNEDANFLFRERAQKLQLVAYNQGEDALVDASLSLVLPNHGSFYVADSLPRRFVSDRFIERTPDELARYPAVMLKDDAVQVSCAIGDLPAGEPVEVFPAPLRMCIGSELSGRRFGVRYSLHAQNLRAPVRGRLKIRFN